MIDNTNQETNQEKPILKGKIKKGETRNKFGRPSKDKRLDRIIAKIVDTKDTPPKKADLIKKNLLNSLIARPQDRIVCSEADAKNLFFALSCKTENDLLELKEMEDLPIIVMRLIDILSCVLTTRTILSKMITN